MQDNVLSYRTENNIFFYKRRKNNIDRVLSLMGTWPSFLLYLAETEILCIKDDIKLEGKIMSIVMVLRGSQNLSPILADQ